MGDFLSASLTLAVGGAGVKGDENAGGGRGDAGQQFGWIF